MQRREVGIADSDLMIGLGFDRTATQVVLTCGPVPKKAVEWMATGVSTEVGWQVRSETDSF
jgi:hypothetical protein